MIDESEQIRKKWGEVLGKRSSLLRSVNSFVKYLYVKVCLRIVSV